MTFNISRPRTIELRSHDDIMYAKLINGVLSVRKRSHGETRDHVVSVLDLVRMAYGEKAYICFDQKEKDETPREGV